MVQFDKILYIDAEWQIRSKSKPEIKFQYGGRPFAETGSTYISAVDWDILSKFGTEIDFRLLKQVSLTA